eukprot:scaffold641_cov237-Pinguiococcus_pyrenoidosus.AAC.9
MRSLKNDVKFLKKVRLDCFAALPASRLPFAICRLPFAACHLALAACRSRAAALQASDFELDSPCQVTDLRAVERTRESRNGALVNSTDERRRARRLLTRIQKKEHAADQEYEKKMQELELAEESGPEVSEMPQPSLGAVMHLMVKKLVIDIPRETCQVCEQRVFPENPDSDVLNDAEAPLRPLRVFCGHYFHWQCLDAWMSTPPFVRYCKHCERRIYHPDWPSDHRIMERAWANKQAREREVNDVSDFLGVDASFSVK